MRLSARALALGLLVGIGLGIGVGVGGALLPRQAPVPQDRPLPHRLPEAGPLRLAVLGTSLSHGEIWPDRLGAALAACLGRPVSVEVIARPGANVTWGLEQVGAVAAGGPDVVLVEFAINDADLRDGVSLRASRAAHAALIDALRAAQPEVRIVLMTMTPPRGLRGLLRPRLAAHHRHYRALAETQDLGLIDLAPRWRALPRAERGLEADGLHPDPDVAAGVIVPVAAAVLGGPNCP